MVHGQTVGEVLDGVRERRRAKRCPNCRATVSIRGFDGEYQWRCLECETVGIGYATRAAALDGVRNA